MSDSVSILPAQHCERGGWRIDWFERLPTTQLVARPRPAWSAVVADEQTAGRGQAERRFVSDRGGLYVTAVLPYAGDPLAARGFALAVGWALRAELLAAGVVGLRLRWPNDLLIGMRKVGGILVEQGSRDTLLVGFGLNVTNTPWRAEPELRALAGSLAESGAARVAEDRSALVALVLRAIRTAHEVFAGQRLAGLVPELNSCWGEPRTVELELAPPLGGVARGVFLGLDAEGALRLQGETGTVRTVLAHQVGRLREVV